MHKQPLDNRRWSQVSPSVDQLIALWKQVILTDEMRSVRVTIYILFYGNVMTRKIGLIKHAIIVFNLKCNVCIIFVITYNVLEVYILP